ncbi:MAG TPA: four-carbon acid sugar kinase family protein [Chthoniobacterales bacterium]|nr:four-carbon acid sugar kinase family protein [Chthoniobacterales bacterium]
MQISIKRAVERIPGGLMVVPLLAGSILATFAPEMPKFFGSFTAERFAESKRKPGMTDCLILADDLSGAADCAVSALPAGLDAEVFLTADGAPEAATAVVAIDLNTREVNAERARALTFKSLEKIHPCPDLFLYRKIDSTLRGNVAVELAATRAAAGKRFIVLAPAFPANRRTTVGGRILVDGEPLERTQFWTTAIPTPDFGTQLADAGLIMESIPLETVRRGKQEIQRTISDLVGEGCTTILCDAERDEDLLQIAQAGFEFGPQALFAGSAGLARQLFKLFPAGELKIPVPRKLSELVLMVVGSLRTNSQAQFTKLRGVTGLQWFLLDLEELETAAIVRPELQRVLDSGRDVAVAANAETAFPDAKPSEFLARLLAPLLGLVGALVVTGGETCRALLEVIGAQKLQLLDELEPGVSLGFVSSPRPLLVVVKAGGFGNRNTLQNAYRFLKKMRISHE